MGQKVLEEILSEVKKGKYYGISNSIDSTPDISHTDQLAVILRYILDDGMVAEQFLKFTPVEHHEGDYLFNLFLDILQTNGIAISGCRSQSYDNAPNISGIYSGVQARIKEVNPLAEWAPCEAHSLNLVGSVDAEASLTAVNFFGIVQSVYNFFSVSPQRWSKLMENLKGNPCLQKSLSQTRWSAGSDAVQALFMSYRAINKSLLNVAANNTQPPAAVQEAKSLSNKLEQFASVLMCVIWNDILQKVNTVNKALQEPGIELCNVVKLYDTLLKYLFEDRERFDEYEKNAKELSDEKDCKEQTQRNRTRKQFHDEGSWANDVSDMTPRDKFRMQPFFPIVDALITEMPNDEIHILYLMTNSDS